MRLVNNNTNVVETPVRRMSHTRFEEILNESEKSFGDIFPPNFAAKLFPYEILPLCIHFLLPSCQFTAYMRVSVRWPDMAFCFMPGVSRHHKDDVGCTSTPF
jgi:hypothetical protein